jgi:tetratricopeptide (TPR) repeat protein
VTTRVVAWTAVVLLGVASPSRGDDLRERARQEFSAARVDFDAGRFEVALAHLERAYALVPHPELLFNIARCLEELHRTPAAVEAYDRYLAVMPSDTAARDRVTALRKQLAANPPPPDELSAATTAAPLATTPAPTPAATTPALVAEKPAPAARPLYRRWWLWTAVAGVVVVGAGVGLAIGLTRPSPPSSFPPLTAQ